jgi:hypothetical protein
MTDQSSLPSEQEPGHAAIDGPAADGGPQATPKPTGDYRDELLSRRWNAAPLENPEVDKTDPRIAVAGIVILSAITLIVLVVGYGRGFWG